MQLTSNLEQREERQSSKRGQFEKIVDCSSKGEVPVAQGTLRSTEVASGLSGRWNTISGIWDIISSPMVLEGEQLLCMETLLGPHP